MNRDFYFDVLDPPGIRPWANLAERKTTTLVRDIENFIHTKCHQNPSSGSGEEVESVNCLKDGRRTTRDHNRSLEPSVPVP